MSIINHITIKFNYFRFIQITNLISDDALTVLYNYVTNFILI